ncbi:hypothetical protein EZV73_09470 [Acidaminobacter sp. JC074]|uniref:Spy/CpxP family protein refolding chaperone n=1 Tax=Acidaminobacter sp. JC074 TaxID=2530199 RepID=UPI001F0E79E3|nr:hypothetical protein [Acidaminobacter sp. JC074]MCH4887802.1 hypothetical protein [Acidaminobacter sp. JC074]
MKSIFMIGMAVALLSSSFYWNEPKIDENSGDVNYISSASIDGVDKPPRDESKPGDKDKRPPRREDENKPPRKEGEHKPPKEGDKENMPLENDGQPKYSIEQAVSDNAQLNTIAFSGLAYLTGTQGADSFLPPGKVADFFGFQYMRDVDIAGYGHNTTFLTKAAMNVLSILNEDQLESLKVLANEQFELYEDYGYGRLTIIDAFRKTLSGSELDVDAVSAYSGDLFEIDGQLSYHRAQVLGEIVRSFSDDQKAYLEAMAFDDSSTWPEIDEEGILDKRSMSHLEHVAVMTYASELFSWYKGSLEADSYFCPERHGTYFGGFYMKDYPAMNNPDYFISTSLTGNSGKEFLEILNDNQRQLIESIIEEQRNEMNRIVEIRGQVSRLLRDFMIKDDVDEAEVMALMEEYGQVEGRLSSLYAERFAAVSESLTEDQFDALYTLRNQYVFPDGDYLYSQPIESYNADGSSLLK